MKDLKWPDFLKSGDTVALVATARHANRDDVQKAISYIESWGLKVQAAENLDQQHFIFAGTEQVRRKALQKAMDDKMVKAIFCLRGGYGTHRLIDHLNFKGFKQAPKWIVGYSDITVLLNHVAQYRIPSVHGPMPFSFYKEAEQDGANRLKALVMGTLPSYEFQGNELNYEGIAEGKVIGGNLSVLHAMTGTESDISWKNKILFIEEVDEYIYHIERMLYHFSRMGRMEGLAGIVVGHLTSIKDNTEPFGLTVQETIERIIRPYRIPLAFSFPAGHELPNMPLIIGAHARLEVSKTKSTLTFLK
jgi:muramoyltetrapeptide carboxypeptidase